MEYKILLIEDNVAISESIKTHLQNENFLVSTALSGDVAIKLFNESKFDLILLDLLLPQISGEEVLNYIRRKSDVPIIIISMKSTDIEKAINLGLGADDFLSKPFSMLELLARVKAVLRRSRQNEIQTNTETYKVGDYIVNFNDYSVRLNDQNIGLTTKEFEILKLLITNPNKVFSKSDIYSIIWKDISSSIDNVLNVHIRNLREKIEKDPNNPIYVKTVWGFGYKLGVEVQKIK
jgi:DNA-binding response OmpR family regulator